MNEASSDLSQELETLREKLAEAEELLRAIRAGEVDAIVVDGQGAPAVYTLKSASDSYRLIVEQMSEGALTVSSDGIILYCNAAFARLTGRPRERLTGTSMTALVVDDGATKLARLCAEDAGGTISISLKDAAGAIVPTQISSTPILIDNESVHCLVVTDLSRQEMLAQAEKLSALGLLAGGVAHDFNNIVQGVAGCASLIGRYADDTTKVKKYAQMLEDAAWRGASITRRLLALARRDELRTEAVDVRLLLEDMRSMLSHTLGAHIAIHLDLAPDLAPALADKGQLEAVLVNLATNSRDALHDGGTITFSAVVEEITGPHPADLRPGAYLRLAVADDGVGMDATTLKRAVEPFFTTKAPGKGTGLGLSMARGFAEQSKGALTVSSEPGRGTLVTLWLPAAAVASARPEAARNEVNALATGTPRILLADDEKVIREVLARELTDRGYQVVLAESGAAALALLDSGEHVDMIVTDLSMPGMDGVTLIGAVQRRHPQLPAILLTGYAGEATTLAIGKKVDGSATLLRKPISGAQLADSVAMMLAATETFLPHSE
jgi:PAS domain S-box-containing protein